MKGKMMTRLGAVAIAVFAAVALVACGSGYSKAEAAAKAAHKAGQSASVASYSTAVKTAYLGELSKDEIKKVKEEYNKIAKEAKANLKKYKKGEFKFGTVEVSKEVAATSIKAAKSYKFVKAEKVGETTEVPAAANLPYSAVETYKITYKIKETTDEGKKLGDVKEKTTNEYTHETVFKVGKKWYSYVAQKTTTENPFDAKEIAFGLCAGMMAAFGVVDAD